MQQEIQELFRACARQDDTFAAGVRSLAARFGDEVYREILWQLFGTSFDADRARSTWEGALDHGACSRPGIGLRPALLDYLQRVAGVLHDPRVLEAERLEGLRQAAVSDGLTGLFNQTHFKLTLAHLLEQAPPAGRMSLAVVLFDLDHFKLYNDRCGHLAGDRALARVAEIIREATRQGDLAARYGGEEFALLLHRVEAHQVRGVAERIRQAVAAEPFPGQEQLPAGSLTISGGFALYRAGDTASALLERADGELYGAKQVRDAIRPAVPNQRRSPRRGQRSVIEFAPRGSEAFLSGLSLDVSSDGLALGCDRLLEPGAVIRLRFRRPFWPVERQVDACVRHVLPPEAEDGLVRVGLEFLYPQAVLAEAPGQAAREAAPPA